jgi:hypothetical protein
MTIGNPDSPPAYEMPTQRALLRIELVDVSQTVGEPSANGGEAVHEDKKPGISGRITAWLLEHLKP